MNIWLFLAIFLLTASTAFAAGSGNILGIWKTDGGDSRLELFKCGNNTCGKIVWLKVPKYINSKDGPVGKIKFDRKNPDSAQRNRPIMGLVVMKGFSAKGSNQWVNGTSYNPETGNSYTSTMHLEAPDRLILRGYIGISIIGHSLVLTRVKTPVSKAR
jgi:uncharacterized protein (DUF2147 family)